MKLIRNESLGKGINYFVLIIKCWVNSEGGCKKIIFDFYLLFFYYLVFFVDWNLGVFDCCYKMVFFLF